MKEDKLQPEDLELVWGGTQQGDQIKTEVYKLLKEIAQPLKFDSTKILTEKIAQIAPEKVVNEEVELLFAMGKYTKGTAEYSVKIAQLLWQISTREDMGYKKEISELGMSRFCEMVSYFEKPNKEKFFLQCIENLQEHKCAYQSITILKKMIKDLKSNERTDQMATRIVMHADPDNTPEYMKTADEFIAYLVNEKQLLEVFFKDFDYYTEQVKTLLESQPDLLKQEKLEEKVLCGSFTH